MKKSEQGGNRPPRPAQSIIDQPWAIVFEPAVDLLKWVRDTVLNPESPLYNEDHAHLAEADIGILWTNTENSSKGRKVIGTAEEPVFRCSKWQKFRQEMQIIEWFGQIPDFIITLDANYCFECSDIELLSLIEHELYHCAQAVDAFGSPKFNQDTGRPMFCMRGHDVEEFIGVVRRYGVGQPDSPLAQLVLAANRKPEIDTVSISRACGTCMS